MEKPTVRIGEKLNHDYLVKESQPIELLKNEAEKKIEIILLITIVFAMISCNETEKNDATSETTTGNSIELSTATLKGDELIKTNFGDIQLNQSYLSKESLAKLN